MRELARTQPNGGPLAPITALRREMDRLFETFSPRIDLGGWAEGRFLPEFDYAETDTEIIVTAELPGVDPKDVEISLEHNLLTIRGEKRSQRDEKKEHYQFAERSYGAFERTMTVPEGVEASKVEAKFDKGVLKVTLPKPAELQGKRRKIEVKAS
jgi:HSP20 family protein